MTPIISMGHSSSQTDAYPCRYVIQLYKPEFPFWHPGLHQCTPHLAQNTKLSDRLTKLVPPGTNLENAAQGFNNLGQFVAAVHVSHNLDIPFSDLKSKMMSGDSLGQAIRDLRPGVSAKDETKKMKRQAKETLRKASL
jgi:hypothetical protein